MVRAKLVEIFKREALACASLDVINFIHRDNGAVKYPAFFEKGWGAGDVKSRLMPA